VLLDELELLLELDDEVELLLDDEELDVLLVVDVLELDDDELDDVVPLPTQAGATKLPSWLPWKPNDVLPPDCRLPFQLMLLAFTVLPLVLRLTFQLPVVCGASLKFSAICQLLTALLPLLVTVTSS
jgi:hypothetical protein